MFEPDTLPLTGPGVQADEKLSQFFHPQLKLTLIVFKQEFWRSIGLGNGPSHFFTGLQTHIPGPQTENVVAPFGSVSNGRHSGQQQEGGRRDGNLLQSVCQGHLRPLLRKVYPVLACLSRLDLLCSGLAFSALAFNLSAS